MKSKKEKIPIRSQRLIKRMNTNRKFSKLIRQTKKQKKMLETSESEDESEEYRINLCPEEIE